MLKQINILGLRCRKLRTFPGKFLNFGKSAGVKDLTNIMSDGLLDNGCKNYIENKKPGENSKLRKKLRRNREDLKLQSLFPFF